MTPPTERSSTPLVIEISSFSYKNALAPHIFSWDEGRHGGGFVFDCRALPNPGRSPQFQILTGLDLPVVQYLNSCPEVSSFERLSFPLVFSTVENYLSRKFTFLSVSFGCTGGQHRSVYFVEKLRAALVEKFGDAINVVVHHVNLRSKGLLP
jgi:RNase adaptor protein for sRNA GlmZ degradation